MFRKMMCLAFAVCCSAAPAQVDRVKVALSSESFPATYRIKVKVEAYYKILDIAKVHEAQHSTPSESDFAVNDKSPDEFRFEISYASGKPKFSGSNQLVFNFKGKPKQSPKGYDAVLSFPIEYEIYDGSRLVRRATVTLSSFPEMAFGKTLCLAFRKGIRDAAEPHHDLRLGVSLAPQDLDWSKTIKVPGPGK